MPWPRACAVCGSRDIQATVDEVLCLACGRLTDKNGVAVPLLDQYSSEELINDNSNWTWTPNGDRVSGPSGDAAS